MTTKELDQKIRNIAPEWMVDEADDLIEMASAEDWESPPQNIMECMDWWDGQDWTNDRKYKLAVTKIERAIGMQKKLGKGEVVQSFGSRGSRTYREGDWVFDKRWDELIDEDDV